MAECMAAHAELRDDSGHRLVVRKGRKEERERWSGANWLRFLVPQETWLDWLASGWGCGILNKVCGI